MKKNRRESLTVEDILNYLDDECDDEAPEIELTKQVLEQLLKGNNVSAGDEFLTPGYILLIEGEEEDEED